MDTLLVVLGFICCLVGLVGSFLPVLPGVSLCWMGLLLLYLTEKIPMNYWILGITFLLMICITILDYTIPAQTTKKFGGSKYGIWGANLGLVFGLFVPPLGLVFGPFVGALVGELLFNFKDKNRAIRSAFGTFVGFLVSSVMKFVVCLSFLILFIFVWIAK